MWCSDTVPDLSLTGIKTELEWRYLSDYGLDENSFWANYENDFFDLDLDKPHDLPRRHDFSIPSLEQVNGDKDCSGGDVISTDGRL